MTDLTAAHRGYEYQDLLIASRLVDLLLGTVVSVQIDRKLTPEDRFDDLTALDIAGHTHRTQFKHRDNEDQPLTLATFTSDARSLRLDRLIVAAAAHRSDPGGTAIGHTFRVVLRDARPVDERLTAVLRPASPDPGPFLPGMQTLRLRFDAAALWRGGTSADGQGHESWDDPFVFLREGERAVTRADLDRVCDRLVIEVEAPAASGDLTAPAPAEWLLLTRVRAEVGAESYPNNDRSAVDVAEAVIRTARAARQGQLVVTSDELLRRTQLRNDFGAVARAHPVDRAVEVARRATVEHLTQTIGTAAVAGGRLIVVGPPGQGKSWVCQQLIDELSDDGWLVAEHYCYLGDADGERIERVLAESVFGSLMGRLAEAEPSLVAEQRPRFAADEEALIDLVARATEDKPGRPIALIIDGIDHVTRVRAGGSSFDPSFTLAEALSGLELPAGTVLVILSQPGDHLRPLEETGAAMVSVPGLDDVELRQLAARLGLVPPRDEPIQSGPTPPLLTEEAAEEFLAILAERSAGNALYATYLCREAFRQPATVADPSAAVRALPPFDGTLENYYRHLHGALGGEAGWVADIVALLDFAVTRSELREIQPHMAHRVDDALSVLEPVLIERATQGGVRIYHESFARFLRQAFHREPSALLALLDQIAAWLKGKGLFTDPRAFRSLLPILTEAGHYRAAVDFIDENFVIRGVAAGFPASAIRANLGTAISCAARINDWPAVVRCVELARAAETYQDERYDSTLVTFADVPSALLGRDVVADRLLHESRPVMPARAGLQMCAAVDRLGAVAPWREYMTSYVRESEKDNTSYGEASDRQVSLAWLRGRLRLSAVAKGLTNVDLLPEEAGVRATGGTETIRPRGEGFDVAAPVSWSRLAREVERQQLPVPGIAEALLDTYGLPGIVELIYRLNQPGDLCLALAEQISIRNAPDTHGSARRWAIAAAGHGTTPGTVHRLLALGVHVDDIAVESVAQGRENLLELTRRVLDSSMRWERGPIQAWTDACAVAARRDPIGLGAAEALVEGPGWYRCWLRFTMVLVRAEASAANEQPPLALDALNELRGDLNPFTGSPRACDLYFLHGLIEETIRRAVALLDDDTWTKGVQLLKEVSESITTTLFGELSGPLPPDRLLRMVVETTTPACRSAAESLVLDEIENGGGSRFYADLAEYRLVAARLALAEEDREKASRLWTEACRMLTAYGWHKDITLYELLDPLPALITADPARGRTRVRHVQPLCERIPLRTDGRETRHAWAQWWTLLAKADPVALSGLASPALLADCNSPNSLLHDALRDLSRTWQHDADPIVAGALRLTLDAALDPGDHVAIGRLRELMEDGGREVLAYLMTLLMARLDERPARYSVTNSDELLEQDAERVNALNSEATRAGVPSVFPIPPSDQSRNESSPIRRVPSEVTPASDLFNRGELQRTFPPGAAGLARAIRAWRSRRYDEAGSNWTTDRVANVLGYRVLELAEAGREEDAASALHSIADAAGFDERSGVLATLAQGLERNGQTRLATIAHTLTWTRARGHGGWLTFGGETEIASLRRAAELDQELTLSIISEETSQIVSRGRYGSYGISQALMYGFVMGGLEAGDEPPLDTAFRAWDQAFAVIATRAPRVHSTDDPDEPYTPVDPDEGVDVPGDLDAAMATAAVAGVSHPARENKRRSFLAARLLLAERPAVAAPAFRAALATLSDPATLTWLLRILEETRGTAGPVVTACSDALIRLAGGPHLTVRVLARRLLSDDDLPIPPPTPADPALTSGESDVLWTPLEVSSDSEDATGTDELVGSVAGVRLARAEHILPGLGAAVRARVAAAITDEPHKRRMRTQLDALSDRIEKRWPDAYLMGEEAVEDALQRAATGGRAARVAAGLPISDPAAWEDELANALLDDPALPLNLEATRQPRPLIPPPPGPADEEWDQVRAATEGSASAHQHVEAAAQDEDLLLGTLTMSDSNSVATSDAGKFQGWRILGTVERRTGPSPYPKRDRRHFAKRYRVVEVRMRGDRQALTLPPVASGDIRVWALSLPLDASPQELAASGPIIGVEDDVDAAGDAHHGLGIHAPLLAPTPLLVSVLGLHPGEPFVLEDDHGPALALLTWRTEYETSEYHLPWPRLRGSAILTRGDVFDQLVKNSEGHLVFRDFIVGEGEARSPEEESTS